MSTSFDARLYQLRKEQADPIYFVVDPFRHGIVFTQAQLDVLMGRLVVFCGNTVCAQWRLPSEQHSETGCVLDEQHEMYLRQWIRDTRITAYPAVFAPSPSDKRILELEAQVRALWYAPGAPGYIQAQTSFESKVNTQRQQ